MKRQRQWWQGILLFGLGLCLSLTQSGWGLDRESDSSKTGQWLTLELRTRDAATGEIRIEEERVEAGKVGVVVVDPWNYHWCMTACERVSAMVPRWNKALECARRLGMVVVWAPSDTAGKYAGWPQRERALAVPYPPIPAIRTLECKFTTPVGACMCGPGFACQVNYGEDGIHPDLIIKEEDFIISATEEVYALLQQRNITHLIYMGLHTNMCLYGKPGALRFMHDAGLKCMLARDINDAFSQYDPATGYTPDRGTKQTDDDLEKAGIPTINVLDEMRMAGVWDKNWMGETVRIVPWGKPNRPYVFENSVRVTLSTPWLEDVQIRYTLDGSEPTRNSPVYANPIEITGDTRLVTAAFRKNKRISLLTDAAYVRLAAKPPKPDIDLDRLSPVFDPYTKNGAAHTAFYYLPRINQSYEKNVLRMRGQRYPRGLGFRAPANVRYEIKPEYARFVALAGIDDNLLDTVYGACVAGYPSVIFRIFIDGEPAADSPVMRISQEPWRFDVPIPDGSRWLSISVMDAGTRDVMDLADLTDAGFILK